ncbi:MAG TPA: pitrilysin family protein [Blastocatellia bacterium]|nr:pitrilysin family protein [Blastocatellia bacterium]
MSNSFTARTSREVLSNGIKLLVLENHSNPTVSVAGYLLGGSHFSPSGKYATARLTADMLNKGTSQRSKLEIAEALESVGAGVNITSNTFTVSLNTQSLSRDFPLVVATLAEELRTPTFPAPELEKLQQRSLAAIKRAQDETDRRAMERFSQLVFAEKSPFHIYPADRRMQEIAAITTDDLQQFYENHYGAASLILAVVGDVTAAEVGRLVQEHFGDWRGAPKPELHLPETPLQTAPLRDAVQLQDKASVDVVMGHASRLRRLNDDYLAAIVANRALGQSTLSSRLGLKVRDEMGLTYGINSYFSDSGLGDGPYLITVTVAPENVDLAINTTQQIVEDYVNTGITAEELADEQSAMIGSYKLGLATNAGIAGQLASTELYGLGVHYLDEYPDHIRALDKISVDEAIRKYIHPEVMTTVMAGTFETQ